MRFAARLHAALVAVLAVAVVTPASPAFAQAPAAGKQPTRPAVAAVQPITHEALWMMKRVGAPVLSPDGKWVVFAVTEPAYDEKKEVSDLWIVSADGGAPRRLTSSKAAES